MDKDMKIISGGVVAPQGFKAAGVRCGLKQKEANDLALIVSETEAAAAGVFTTNVVKAACVQCSSLIVKNGHARAIVVNAGNANACNGLQGLDDAHTMMALTAKALGLAEEEVLCASTGVIGHLLPMDKITAGIADAATKLHSGNADDVTSAIMTTDLVPKEIALEITLGGKKVRLGGIAKGSGMIEPNMATMLGFITTDAAIAPSVLQAMLTQCVKLSFNAITVDGDTSTNDMCLALANGMAENPIIRNAETPDGQLFERALYHVCLTLAKAIARDGEGATKLVEVRVRNASSPRKIAKTIANSPLVKTALFGNDPNWGRILAAAGRSGVAFDPLRVVILLAGTKVYENGQPVAFDPAAVSAKMKAKEVVIDLDFRQASGSSDTVYTCDFSYDYIKINADYHT